MTDLVIPAAGAFIGSYFGPVGMQLGWLAGSYLTNDSSSSSSEQGSAQAALPQHVMTAQYNTPIPVVYGMQRVGGIIVWALDAIPYTRGKRDVKTGETEVTGFYLTLAIIICEGPILGIRKVWSNGDLIIDCTSGSKPLIGTLYNGSLSQTPDPTMTTYLGNGNVPAYRGLAYMVLNNFDNGSSSSPPQFSFEVIKGL